MWFIRIWMLVAYERGRQPALCCIAASVGPRIDCDPTWHAWIPNVRWKYCEDDSNKATDNDIEASDNIHVEQDAGLEFNSRNMDWRSYKNIYRGFETWKQVKLPILSVHNTFRRIVVTKSLRRNHLMPKLEPTIWSIYEPFDLNDAQYHIHSILYMYM